MATPPRRGRKPRRKPEERHLRRGAPDERVQVDCFRIGRLRKTKGVVWKRTVIDVGRAYGWAELHVTPTTPQLDTASQGVQRVARDLQRFDEDLKSFLNDSNTDRAHTGRWTQARTPAQVGAASEMYSGR